MAETIDNLLVGLGLQTDADSFKQAESQFDSLQSKALQFGAVIGSGFGFYEMTAGISQAVNEMNKFSQEYAGLDVTPQFVNQLQGAFRLIDEEGRSAFETIKSMADLIEDADWGDISGESFAKGLDISAIQNAETAREAMLALNEQMRGMDEKNARELGQTLGMSGPMIRMFRDNDIAARMEEARSYNPLSEEMVEASQSFTEGWNKLQEAMTGLQRSISVTFVGDMGDSMSNIADYMKDNRDKLETLVDTAIPHLKGAAAGIGTLVALRSARAGLGFLSQFPGSTAIAAGVGVAAGDESFRESVTGGASQSLDELRGLGESLGLEWLANIGKSSEQIRREQELERQARERGELQFGGPRGDVPMPDAPRSAPDAPPAWRDHPSRQGDTYNITVDARGSRNPAEVEADAERGAITALRRASENTLRDLASEVE